MKYQYTSTGSRQYYNRPSFSMPSGVKFLLITNIIIFILMELSGQKGLLFKSFGLVPKDFWQELKIWQPFTYLFLHGGFFHIFFNMFVLWMFGKDLESQWGKNEFLVFYFVSGIGAGIATILFNLSSFIPIVGASGAIYGLLLAYGLTYPNRMVYLYGVFPLKVKYVVLGLGGIAFFASLFAKQSNISHLTHLSGMIIGFIYMNSNISWRAIKLWCVQMRLKNIKNKHFINDKNNDEIRMKLQVDKILDKLNELGWEGLTEQEERVLTLASKQFYRDRPPN